MLQFDAQALRFNGLVFSFSGGRGIGAHRHEVEAYHQLAGGGRCRLIATPGEVCNKPLTVCARGEASALQHAQRYALNVEFGSDILLFQVGFFGQCQFIQFLGIQTNGVQVGIVEIGELTRFQLGSARRECL